MVVLYNAAEKAKTVKNRKELKLPWPQNPRFIAARAIIILMEMQGGVFGLKLKIKKEKCTTI